MADSDMSHTSRPSSHPKPVAEYGLIPPPPTTASKSKTHSAMSKPGHRIAGRITNVLLPPNKMLAPSKPLGPPGPPGLQGPPGKQGPPGPPGGWLSHSMSKSQEIAFNIMICTVQLVPQACLTTCFPILRLIAHTFSIKDPSLLPWFVAAYALSFGTTILLAGRLGDIFGHKLMVILGFCWLCFFSVVGGLSNYTSYELFFVARAFQGVGAAIMNPNALALLGRSYPPGSTGKIIAFSAFGLCAPLGAYSGMLGSAIIGQLWFWPWAFYITAVVCAFLAVIAFFILPSPPKSPKQMLPFGQKLASMDWLGGLTGVSGLVCIQVALICAPTDGWQTQYVFMLFILGLLLVVFFVIVELKIAKEPLAPFRLLNSNVAFVLAAIACGWGTFGVWTFYLWKFFLNVWQDTPLQAALYALPIVPVALFAAALTAVLMRTIRPAWILFWALVAFTLGPMFLAFNHLNTTYWTFTFVSLLVTPFGMDMSFPSATFIMSNCLPMDKQGVAGSLIVTVVNYSIALGLGLASTVEVHVNHHNTNLLGGIRGAWLFGLGLGGLGIVVCMVFVLKTWLDDRRKTFANLPMAEETIQRPTEHKPSSLTGIQKKTSRSSAIWQKVEVKLHRPQRVAIPDGTSRTHNVTGRHHLKPSIDSQYTSDSTDLEMMGTRYEEMS